MKVEKIAMEKYMNTGRHKFNALRRPGRFYRRWGGAVLEAALVLPVILSLAFGTVEFGYFFYVKHTLQGAAREGARASIVSGATQSDVTTAVANYMTASGLSSSGYTVTTTPSNIASAAVGTSVQVQVQCTWGTVGKGFSPLGLIGIAKTVAGATVMRKEG